MIYSLQIKSELKHNIKVVVGTYVHLCSKSMFSYLKQK